MVRSPRVSAGRGVFGGMGMTLDIWWISGSPYAWWVLLAAEVKGLAYEGHMLSKRKERTAHPNTSR